jgi:hypothetical protein
MKKLIALLMVCGFAFAFVACGGGSKNEAESADTTTEAPVVTPDTTATDTTVSDTTTAQ